MKKIIILLLAFSVFPTVNADTDLRDYFILDKWHDLGIVKPTNQWYYIPTIPYTDAKNVQYRLEKNYNYVWDFYKSHNFKKEFINWLENNSNFYVKWDKPVVFNDIEKIRKYTANFHYSYRKNWEIMWQKWDTMPEHFVTWYNSKDNKLVILYPIKDKYTWKTEAFVQYPCGNLVCKDTNCSILKKTKAPKCWDHILDKKEQCDDWNLINWDGCSNTCKYEKPSCSITPKYSCIDNWSMIKDVFNVNSSNWKPNTIMYDFRNVDKYYKLQRWGTSNITLKYTNFLNPNIENMCSAEIKVRSKAFCWDWIVNNNEICDPNDSKTWALCTKTCEAKKPTKCDIEISWDIIKNKSTFIWIWKDYYSSIKEVKLDNEKLEIRDNDYSFFNIKKAWTYTVSLTLANKLDPNVTTSCKKEVEVLEQDLCR